MKIPGFILAAIIILMIAGCRKHPPFEDLSNDFVVLTKYDSAAEFGSYQTFAVRDTIGVITGDPDDSVWFDNDAQSIIGEVIAEMVAAGYTQVPISASPDLGIQLIGLRNTTIYTVPPGYWWGYPGWGSPCYWGYCGGWGYWYPYSYTVAVSTGTLIVEMADLKNAVSNGKINILWNAVGSGEVGTSTSFIVSECIKTVNQAFLQSPYLRK